MAQILYQLANLFFDAIPTILLFVALHLYLKRVLYRPLRQVLQERSTRIEGRLEAARRTLAEAENKLAGIETARRRQLVDNYRRIEERRQAALAESRQTLTEARHQAAQALLEARRQMAEEGQQARQQLQATVEAVAGRILGQVLGGERASRPGVEA